jgi:hypothetical protein
MHLSQLEAFGLTLAVEAATAAVLAPAFQVSRGRAAVAAIAGSTLTHPLLWFGFYEVHSVLGAATTPALEALVIVAEAPFHRVAGARWTEAFLLSLLVNAASWWSGEVIYAL